MAVGRTHREDERTGIEDNALAEPHRLVEVPFELRLGQRDELVGLRVQKQLFLIAVENQICLRVGVRENRLEILGQRPPQPPRHGGQKIRLTRSRGPEHRDEQGLHFDDARGTVRWQRGQASWWQATPLTSMACPSTLNREGRNRCCASLPSKGSPVSSEWAETHLTSPGAKRCQQCGHVMRGGSGEAFRRTIDRLLIVADPPIACRRTMLAPLRPVKGQASQPVVRTDYRLDTIMPLARVQDADSSSLKSRQRRWRNFL